MIVKRILNRLNRVLNNWASNTTWYENVAGFAGCKRILNTNCFDLPIANLGSSSAVYAFNYDAVGLKGLNLATPKQSLLADYEMIRNYFSYLKEGAVVLIPLCLFSALEGEDAEFPDKSYVLLQSESIPHFSWKKKLQVMELFNNPIDYIPFFSVPRALLRPLKPRKTTMSSEELDKDAARWINDWMKEFSIIDFNRSLSLKNQDSYLSASDLLKDIMDFCISRKFKPVVVVPPISNSLANLYTKQMRELLITEFVQKSNKVNVPFLNYIDNKFLANDMFFRNAFFLNDKGANEFTKQLFSDLRNIGYLS